jgi:preprotein translocase subunit SecD
MSLAERETESEAEARDMQFGHIRGATGRLPRLAIAVAITAAACSGGAHHPGGLVTFRFPTTAVSSTQTGGIVTVLTARLKAAGIATARVTTTSGAIEVKAPASAAHAVAVAGRAGQFRLRPVLQELRPCPATTTSPQQDDPNATVTLPFSDPQQGCYQLGPTLLGGDVISSAAAQPPTGLASDWSVLFNFTSGGASAFNKIAVENYQKQIAIVLDSVVESAPTIQAQSYGGSADITGAFTQQQADDVANELCCGSLPFALPAPSAGSS